MRQQLRVVSSEENARGFACRGINGFGDRAAIFESTIFE